MVKRFLVNALPAIAMLACFAFGFGVDTFSFIEMGMAPKKPSNCNYMTGLAKQRDIFGQKIYCKLSTKIVFHRRFLYERWQT